MELSEEDEMEESEDEGDVILAVTLLLDLVKVFLKASDSFAPVL
jgi:hypothetical protein